MKLGRREFLATSAAGLASVGRTAPVSAADDPLGVRKDFPAATNCTYLNSPYITPSPRAVEEAGIEFVRAKSSSPISLGSMLAKGNEARESFAKLFGAKTEEVSFLFATSEGENIVARSVDWTAGDNVVIDDLHYETTYILYQTLAQTKGIDVRIVRSVDGRADPEHFESQVDARTRIVSVSGDPGSAGPTGSR